MTERYPPRHNHSLRHARANPSSRASFAARATPSRHAARINRLRPPHARPTPGKAAAPHPPPVTIPMIGGTGRCPCNAQRRAPRRRERHDCLRAEIARATWPAATAIAARNRRRQPPGTPHRSACRHPSSLLHARDDAVHHIHRLHRILSQPPSPPTASPHPPRRTPRPPHRTCLRARRRRRIAIMLSSICVATITGLPRARMAAHDALLSQRHFLGRQFDAQIPARHHRRIRHIQHRVQLRPAPAAFRSSPQSTPAPRRSSRVSATSSARCTKLSPIKSTPMSPARNPDPTGPSRSTPEYRSNISGTFTPLRSDSAPPVTTSHSRWSPRLRDSPAAAACHRPAAGTSPPQPRK